MKTAYKMLIGVAAIGAVGFVSYKAFNGTRTEAYVPGIEDQPDPVTEPMDLDLADAIKAGNDAAAEMLAEMQQAADAETGNDTPPPAVPEPTFAELTEERHRMFADQIARFSRGGVTTNADSTIAINDDGRIQSITLTRLSNGNPVGHAMVSWNGQRFKYRTDGSFKRKRGTDLDRVLELLLVFEAAIDLE